MTADEAAFRAESANQAVSHQLRTAVGVVVAVPLDEGNLRYGRQTLAEVPPAPEGTEALLALRRDKEPQMGTHQRKSNCAGTV